MDVADKIVATPSATVTSGGGQFGNVPKKDVMIIKVYEEKPEIPEKP